jgi:FkbM family methyltransferase
LKNLAERPVLIAGIGGAAWWILQGFTRNDLPVEGFVVSSPVYESSDTCCGLPVLKAKDWKALPRKQDEYLIVLGVMNPKIDVEKMKSEFLANGWSEILSFAEYGSQLLRERQINCSMIEVSESPSHTAAIQSIRAIMADSKSKRVFDHFLNFCSTFEENDLLIDETPYFVSDLPRWCNPLKMIDCGAFDGDTVLQALDSGYKVDFCLCCEPDRVNYARLVVKLSSVPNVIALPLAVGDKFETKSFDGKGNTGSRVTAQDNADSIFCVTLDHLLPGGKPNLIKMDIEGYEYEALLGSRKLLTESRPGLAISVYHLSDDIIRIPKLIYSLFGDTYLYFLRRHSRTVADTIFYAFPKEKV